MNAPSYSLLVDIGGTNTRVALATGTKVLTNTIQRFKNAEHACLEDILGIFQNRAEPFTCTAIAVDLAGPVHEGVGRLTNLDWTIAAPSLTQVTGAQKVVILNDMQAQGHSIGHVDPANVISVIKGRDSDPEATKLVINVGTGFNAAPVYETDSGRLVPASECGHVNMPIRTEAELRLMRFVETAHGFPAIEDVLSGRGLERIYAWALEENGGGSPLTAAQIVNACEAGTDPIAQIAARQFVHLLGTVSGNLCLVHLPFGGVALVGGVVRALRDHLGPMGFAEAFGDKGRFSDFMDNFSVTLIEDDYAALIGLAHCLAD